MEKIFNKIAAIAALIGGYIANLLGGCDAILISLITLIVLDYITGVLGAIYKAKSGTGTGLSSAIGFKGIIKKVVILIVVAAGVAVQQFIPGQVPVREVIIAFFLCNEALSIIENAAAMGIKLPKKIITLLQQWRDANNGGTEEITVTEEKKEE